MGWMLATVVSVTCFPYIQKMGVPPLMILEESDIENI